MSNDFVHDDDDDDDDGDNDGDFTIFISCLDLCDDDCGIGREMRQESQLTRKKKIGP